LVGGVEGVIHKRTYTRLGEVEQASIY
jgi:hypothetical protein